MLARSMPNSNKSNNLCDLDTKTRSKRNSPKDGTKMKGDSTSGSLFALFIWNFLIPLSLLTQKNTKNTGNSSVRPSGTKTSPSSNTNYSISSKPRDEPLGKKMKKHFSPKPISNQKKYLVSSQKDSGTKSPNISTYNPEDNTSKRPNSAGKDGKTIWTKTLSTVSGAKKKTRSCSKKSGIRGRGGPASSLFFRIEEPNIW